MELNQSTQSHARADWKQRTWIAPLPRLAICYPSIFLFRMPDIFTL
jgi:hypothetical protein